MRNHTPGLIIFLFFLYSSCAAAQQEQAWKPYWYPAGPDSVQPADNGASRGNPWQSNERSKPRRGNKPKHRSSSGMGMGSSRGKRQQPARSGQMRRAYQVPQPERQPAPPLPPTIKTSISETSPYEHQSLIYVVRITSGGNLKSVSLQLPEVDSVVIRQLGNPVTSRTKSDSRTVFTTEYRYLLMPLSAGVVEIPPAVAKGVMASAGRGGGPPVRLVAEQPLVLDVLPAVRAVQPWLPLYKLQIDARVVDQEQLRAGDPVRLEVEVSATGATGAQIPSLASQLASPDFRIYPGKSFTEGQLSADGTELRGRRVEVFTLVPQYGGWLKIPNLSLNWWNVRYRRPEVASLLMDRIKVEGPEDPTRGGAAGKTGPGVFGDAGFLIWVPLMFAVGILLYGWLSAFVGPGRIPGSAHIIGFTRSVLGELYAPVAAFGARVSPRRHFHRLRAWTGRNLPVSWKLWFCLRAVAREDDPDEWGHALQILAAKHLGVRPQLHLKELGKSIVACHPRADEQQVDQLMDELNEAIYGDRPIRSFRRWKQEFERQIKPGLFPLRLRSCQVRRHPRQLPALNPR